MENNTENKPSNFIRTIIDEDLEKGKNQGKVITRFPPEPNGYLHIGHAKSICLNFGLARDYKGTCHLRFDDTNPEKEDVEYIESIQEDVRWLGFDWGKHKYFASDYFDKLYDFAIDLIKRGKAYVEDLSSEEIRQYRGTARTDVGRESPYRDRSVEENLALFEKMKSGDFDEGKKVLRAKIDMKSSNFNMRDPIIYRIKKISHHRTGDKWCIYPNYDFTHCLSDMLEGITHSICTLEFEDHRPLYNWVLEALETPCHPQQIEFARLNLTYMVMSKRKFLQLVEGGHVSGWDDARMPTISGLRRRGYTPAAIRNFCDRIGVAKRDSTVDFALLEHCLREDLNKNAGRVMGILRPLKVIITNYPQGQSEELEAINNPEDESAGTRSVPFSGELYIEREDFMEEPPKKFFRLAPGTEVRLRYAYFIKCEEVVKDPATGEATEIHCTYDPATLGGNAPDGRKVKATLHWVSAPHAIQAEVRLYNHLFNKENPEKIAEGETFIDNINRNSMEVLKNCRLEPSLKTAAAGTPYQFERLGYFCVDSKDSSADSLIFNRTATLKDTWTKIQKSGVK